MTKVDWDRFTDGWASGSMRCHKCGRIFPNVRFLYSCSDKVEGEWPECCGELTKFLPDWKPDIPQEVVPPAPDPNEERRKRVLEC